MRLQINVTKEILEKSKMCCADPEVQDAAYSCAIALAVSDIFPNAAVFEDRISPFNRDGFICHIPLPVEATDFTRTFDKSTPDERVNMEPISFEIEIPDEVINRIDIEQIEEVLKCHPTLQFV